MRITSTVVGVPRSDRMRSQDAACVGDTHARSRVFRSALCDAISESLKGGVFAERLAGEFTSGRLNWLDEPSDTLTIQECGDQWHRHASEHAATWFNKILLDRGVYSTLLGVELLEGVRPGTGSWGYCLCGDTCLAQVRWGRAIRVVPDLASSDFNQYPDLIAGAPIERHGETAPDADARIGCPHVLGTVRTGIASWRAGDRFFMMTDALAKWAITAQEHGATPWSTLMAMATSPVEFQRWVDWQRNGGFLDDDDTTLISIHVTDDDDVHGPTRHPRPPRRGGRWRAGRSTAARWRTGARQLGQAPAVSRGLRGGVPSPNTRG